MLATRSLRLVLPAALAAVSLALAPPALAGKPGGGGKPPRGGSATISLVLLNSSDGLPHWGQSVMFNVATTATTEPFVHLQCHQGGVLVGDGWRAYFDGTLGREFGLYSPIWTSGSADCTASVTDPSWRVLGSTSFHVYG